VSHPQRRIVAGWSRRRFVVDDGPVLDVGSGAFPNRAADVLVDLEVDDDRHRHGRQLVIDRPFVVARVEALPFRDGAFAFVIASHIAEHVSDPAGLCRELSRAARRGYVETPSPFADLLLHEEYHIWRVGVRNGKLIFKEKAERPRLLVVSTDRIYRLFYAGRHDCSRPVARLPGGPVGRAMAFLLRALGAALNRVGLMHTRYPFDPTSPLRFEVQPLRAPGGSSVP